MKVSVCASLTYYYDAEIPDELGKFDETGYLANEAGLIQACLDADPMTFSGVLPDDTFCDIVSVYTADNEEALYFM